MPTILSGIPPAGGPRNSRTGVALAMLTSYTVTLARSFKRSGGPGRGEEATLTYMPTGSFYLSGQAGIFETNAQEGRDFRF